LRKKPSNDRPSLREEREDLRYRGKYIVTPAAAKAKGRRLQQWVRDKLLLKIPGLRAGDVVSTPMGVNGTDVQLSPHALDIIPIQTECKNNKSFAVYKIYDQAKEHGGNEPVVVLKADFKRPLAVIDAEHYLDLWARVLKAERKKT
jgi:hypothetical protein